MIGNNNKKTQAFKEHLHIFKRISVYTFNTF